MDIGIATIREIEGVNKLQHNITTLTPTASATTLTVVNYLNEITTGGEDLEISTISSGTTDGMRVAFFFTDGGSVTFKTGGNLSITADIVLYEDTIVEFIYHNALYIISDASGLAINNDADLTTITTDIAALSSAVHDSGLSTEAYVDAHYYTETFTSGDLSSGILTVTHSLSSDSVICSMFDNTDNLVSPDVEKVSSQILTFDISNWPSVPGTWRVNIVHCA
jgi:hypothetical protein